MNILIGCDVDPVLPAALAVRPDDDPWRSLPRIDDLLAAAGASLPPITWLIRADASVKFATGEYASGYLSRKSFWEGLRHGGHELGWHMHLMSPDPSSGLFGFDPQPAWLSEAHAALSAHFPVRAARTGWNYASAGLLRELDALGVAVDFSALPGNRNWFKAGKDPVHVDWLRCLPGPYHPSADDYQRPGANPLRLLEVPLTQFPNTLPGMLQRAAWRLAHGCGSLQGLGNKTRLMTQRWPNLPRLKAEPLAFFFHPEDLTQNGIENFMKNLASLRGLEGARFITASRLQ